MLEPSLANAFVKEPKPKSNRCGRHSRSAETSEQYLKQNHRRILSDNLTGSEILISRNSTREDMAEADSLTLLFKDVLNGGTNSLNKKFSVSGEIANKCAQSVVTTSRSLPGGLLTCNIEIYVKNTETLQHLYEKDMTEQCEAYQNIVVVFNSTATNWMSKLYQRCSSLLSGQWLELSNDQIVDFTLAIKQNTKTAALLLNSFN